MQINMNDLSPEIAAYIKSLEDKNSELFKENEKLKQQKANLTEMIVKSQKKMFGKSSEQIKYMDGAESCPYSMRLNRNIRQVRLNPQRKRLSLLIPEKPSVQKKRLLKISNTER